MSVDIAKGIDAIQGGSSAVFSLAQWVWGSVSTSLKREPRDPLMWVTPPLEALNEYNNLPRSGDWTMDKFADQNDAKEKIIQRQIGDFHQNILLPFFLSQTYEELKSAPNIAELAYVDIGNRGAKVVWLGQLIVWGNTWEVSTAIARFLTMIWASMEVGEKIYQNGYLTQEAHEDWKIWYYIRDIQSGSQDMFWKILRSRMTVSDLARELAVISDNPAIFLRLVWDDAWEKSRRILTDAEKQNIRARIISTLNSKSFNLEKLRLLGINITPDNIEQERWTQQIEFAKQSLEMKRTWLRTLLSKFEWDVSQERVTLMREVQSRLDDASKLYASYFWATWKFPAYEKSRIQLYNPDKSEHVASPEWLLHVADGTYTMNDVQKAMLQFFQKIWVKNPPECKEKDPLQPKQWAFLHGTTGIGKTHMMMAYARLLLSERYPDKVRGYVWMFGVWVAELWTSGLHEEIIAAKNTESLELIEARIREKQDTFQSRFTEIMSWINWVPLASSLFLIHHKNQISAEYQAAKKDKKLNELKARYATMPFLFLDELTLDVDSEDAWTDSSEFARWFADMILDRYNHRPTRGGLFITSNILPEKFLEPVKSNPAGEVYPHGILYAQLQSRLIDLCRFAQAESHIQWSDYRRRYGSIHDVQIDSIDWAEDL